VQYVFMHMIIYSSDIAAKSHVQPTLKRAAIKLVYYATCKVRLFWCLSWHHRWLWVPTVL